MLALDRSGTIGKPMPLRQSLREAMSAAHPRLHHHPGFAAIQKGTIDLAQYRSLLVRLYGFHLPFEAAVDIAGDRSAWLRADLAAVILARLTDAGNTGAACNEIVDAAVMTFSIFEEWLNDWSSVAE